MADWLQVLIGGFTTGCLYAMLLLGVLIVFQVSKSINFAYGQIGMAGAFSAWAMYSLLGWPVWLALVAGVVIAVVLNTAIDVVAIRHIPEGRPGLDLIVTLGIFLLLAATMQLVIDSNSHVFIALGADTQFEVAGALVSVNDILVTLLTFAAIVVSWLVFNRSAQGTNLRACAEDADIAASSGINVRLVRSGTWAVAGVLAAVVAYFIASRLTVDAFFMTPVLIKTFIAGMIGGLDRFWPPLLAAVGLGVYEAAAVLLFGANAGTPAVFLLIIIVLAVVPKRFVRDTAEARA